MPTVAELKKSYPDLDGLDDNQVVDAVHQAFYSDLSRDDVAASLGIKPPPEPKKPRTLAGVAKDVGISALKGAIGVPEAAVGLADLVTGGRAGQLAESAGFRPKEAKAMLEEGYSDQQKAAFQEVQAAKGLGETFTAAVSNPSTIAHSVIESLPSMGAGGVVGRGAMAIAPKVGGVVASALGEGVVGAGSAAEQIRQSTDNGRLDAKQAGLAGATGALTSVLTLLGGKVSQKLGIADVDTMLSGAATNPVVRKHVVRSTLEGAVSEGVLEELPQSISEQVLQNIALNRPIDEGVNQAAVMGLLSGAAMGGGANVVHSLGSQNEPVAQPAPVIAEPSGPMSRAANLSTPPVMASADLPVDAEAQAEPLVDPVMARIQAIEDPTARTEALAAYNIQNRDDAPKGVKAYNKKLLDGLLLEASQPKLAGSITGKDGATLLSTEPDPLLEAARANQSEPNATKSGAAEDVKRGQFATAQDAQDYISSQRRGASINLPQALPVEFEDGSHGVALQGTPDYPEAERQSKARQLVTAGVQEGDLLNPKGEPFKTKMAAGRVQKTDGGEVVPVTGGFVVRPGANSVQDKPAGATTQTETSAAKTPETAGPAEGGPPAAGAEAGPGALETAGVEKIPAAKTRQARKAIKTVATQTVINPDEDEAAPQWAGIHDEVHKGPADLTGWKEIGKNVEGVNLYEKEGIRRVVQGDYVVTEKAGKPESARYAELRTNEEIAADKKQPKDDRLGRDNVPLGEGGKPYKTKAAADRAKKQQPMMRVLKAEGGFVLAEKTPAQLAAQEKAAKRLAQPKTSPAGQPIPAHAMIAAAGGLAPAERADMGMEGNVTIGNRKLFAGVGKGLTMERATEKLVEDGYLPEGAGHDEARALIKRSLTQPQYTAEGFERLAEAEATTRFEDYLAAQQDAAQNAGFDPFETVAELGFTLEDAESAGYNAADDAIKLEVNALLLQAEAIGLDTDEIKGKAHEQTIDGSEQDYFEATRTALQQAIETGSGDSLENAGQQGDQGSQEGLTAPTREDVLAQQERAEKAEKDKAREDAAAEAKEKQEREQREINDRARQDASADNFQLGQDAGDALAGQGGLFDAPSAINPVELRAKADLQSALADLGDLLGAKFKANMLPEQEQKLLPVLTKLFDAAFRLGFIKFKDAAKFALDQIRAALGADVANAITIDHLQGAYITMAGGRKGADTKRAVVDVETKDEIESHTATAEKEGSDVPNTNGSVERDSEEPAAQPALGEAVSDDGRGTAGGPENAGGRAGRGDGGGQQDRARVSAGGALTDRERSDQLLLGGKQPSQSSLFDAGNQFGERSADIGVTGIPPDNIPAKDVAQVAERSHDAEADRQELKKADAAAVKLADIDSIRATLPQLLPGQQEDVLVAEKRFADPKGYGVLFTNGTGTGKTFSGLGIAKRFALQGKSNTLIAVPDEKIAGDWIEAGQLLGLDITQLKDTKDAGKGIVITTYANLGANDELATREWDLVIPDEVHTLMQASTGEPTGYLYNLRAITYHPDGAGTRHAMLNREDIDEMASVSAQLTDAIDRVRSPSTPAAEAEKYERLSDELDIRLNALRKKLDAARTVVQEEVKAKQGAARPRLVGLSATPFAYEKTVDWANGYLFDYKDGYPFTETSLAYNQPDPRQYFFMTRFGYTMRYNKLTEPDGSKVDRGMLQRQFNGELKKSGALSGRMLDVGPDYDRRFVLVDSAIGNRIDEALAWVSEQARESAKGDSGFHTLRQTLDDQFDYLSRRYLLEAIKAHEVIPIVKKHMAMGRKVVVFHDYKKGGGFNPFDIAMGSADAVDDEGIKKKTEQLNSAITAFNTKFADLVKFPFGAFTSPIAVFKKELPATMVINGDEKRPDLLKRYKAFQDDGTGPQVMLVQSAKNKGWSGHDTTGKHQRVLINLGQPTAPTLAIQQEGRVYRTGQASDAIMRYLNTGTNWEKWAFATTIASRASTAENLGMGELSRALKDSFIAAFEQSDAYPPGHEGEGKGGKEQDKAANNAISEYDRAKTHYWATQKKTSKNKAQEGADYYATPEPVGLKMVEWLDARSGEDTLEPSAGHGAIARWLPETTNRTVIEPSMALRSRLAMAMDASKDRIIDSTFEDLAVVNKYNGIVMNPPFGTAGKTAVDHLAKAATHLRDGGRIVALIPTGPAADKKFEKWMYEKETRPTKELGKVTLDGVVTPIFKGDTIESRASWAPRGVVTGWRQDGPMVRADGEFRGATTLVSSASIKTVTPTGIRTEEFSPAAGLHLVADIKMPQVTFERAGTAVASRIVVIEKQTDAGKAPGQGVKARDLTGVEDIAELFNRLEDLTLPKRNDVGVPEAVTALLAKVEAKAAPAAPAPVAQVAQKADIGAKVVLGDVSYPVTTYTTNGGKELRGVWVKSKSEALSYGPSTFEKRGQGFFVRERDFPKVAAGGREEAATEPVAFSRGPAPSGLTPIKTPAGTAFQGKEVVLGKPRLNVRQPGGAVTRVDYEIRDPARFAMAKDAGMSSAAAREESTIGFVVMDVDKSGLFKSLRNIEIFETKRGGGMAEKVIGSIMATLPDDAKLHIHDILPTATGFWDKMGAKFARSEDYMEAFLTPQQFRSAYDARSSNPRTQGPQGESGEAVFSRGRQGRSGNDGEDFSGQPQAGNASEVKRSTVEAAVKELTKNWANAPAIVVASDMLDSVIPKKVRDYNNTQQSLSAGGAPEGFFWGGKAYVLADQVAIEDVPRVVFHETLGHYGLRGSFGKALDPILEQLVVMRRAEVTAKAKEYGLDLTDKAQRTLAAEEVLAEMAQTRPELGYVKRAIAAIRTWLRENIPGFKDLELTDAEIIRSYILPARGFVERGASDKKLSEAAERNSKVSPVAFSLSKALDGALNNAKDVKLPAGYLVGDFFNGAGKLNWWHKSVGTMYNLAQRNPPFKRVYDGVQNFLNDVSFYATEAADLAPNILPKLDTWKDITKTPLSPADNKAIAAPIFEGTLVWGRDSRGQPTKMETLEADAAKLTTQQKATELLRSDALTERMLKAWQGLPLGQYETLVESRYKSQKLKAGIVWKDAELKSIFKLTDGQVKLYREFRAAIDKSLTGLAISDMVRYGGKDIEDVKDAAMAAETVEEASSLLRDYLMTLSDGSERKDVLIDMAGKMIEKSDRARELMDQGYAPLSRFGTHSVDVVDSGGERVYFGLFESKAEATKMARRMAVEFPKAAITQGTTSEQAYKLFAGVSPETLELFGEMLGLESQGDDASSKAFQEYLKLARSSRSAMKRLIQRKGIAGFSEDPGRVLAGFIYSNARQASGGLHMGEITDSVNAIPQGQGELKDAAIGLADYIKNPQEEAQKFRGLLFAQYLGGSVASAMVNMTQPLTVTFPYLSQFGGVAKAANQMRQAAADVMKKTTGDKELDAALKRAEEEGVVAPQEVHQLMAQANGSGSLKSGDGTQLGNATAYASNKLTQLSFAWGKLFSSAEQFNRRLTFIAAYRTAVEQKMGNPAAFAEKVIAETQFTYNKGSKPRWARGAIGGTLFTFKQYSVNYLELASRMATQGGPEGKKAALLMVSVLFLMGGAGGLPFAEDAEDLIDGIMQRLGYNFSAKQKRNEFFANLLGKEAAQFLDNGISGLPGVPIDLSGRMGMGNLIPGTGLLTKKRDHTRDVVELAGPAGDLVSRAFQSANALAGGEVGKAGETLLPVAGRNLMKAADMATTGLYRDEKGRKVLDVDAYDVLAKGIGFQPNDVARVQDATRTAQNLIGQVKLRETEIADKWAQGVFEQDQDKVAGARAELKAWNDNNPDAPIRIQMPQIIKRVRAMRLSKADRMAATAPKEIRASVKKELAAAD